MINIIKKGAFGNKRIDKVKLSDAKSWLIKLQADGRGYSTIHTVRGVVRPAFQMAVDDDLIRKNPFEFQLATVVVNDSVTREAITRKQQRTFLEFIKADKHFNRYYEGIYILFHTGLCISEFVGLTVSDIDLENGNINIDHQLQRTELLIREFCILIKMVCQWLLFIGKSISSIYVKSTIKFTKKNCQRLHLMYAGIPFVPTWRNRE